MRSDWGLLPHMRHKFNLLVPVSDNLARSEKLGQALNSAIPAVEDVIGLLLREKGGPAADSRHAALHFLCWLCFLAQSGTSQAAQRYWTEFSHPSRRLTGTARLIPHWTTQDSD